MKLLVVVSEFPKLTETFAYRNVVEYGRLGHEAWIFHNKPFRQNEIVHNFIIDLLPRAFTYGYLSREALGGLFRETLRHPVKMARLIASLLPAHLREPKRGLALLALLPKAVALGRWCRAQDIGHIHAEFAGHPANTGFIAAQVAGVPYSFSAHANDIFVSQALLIEKARAAQFVRAISTYNIQWLSDLAGFPVEKLKLIRCGVTRSTLSVRLPEAPGLDGLQILYVGSLIKKKGVSHLLDALSALPQDMVWRARIIGGGHLFDSLKAQADRLGLSGRVRFDGPQPAEKVSEAYDQAHVLVVPSIPGDKGRVEGIPVVLMEAMARGRVVIASNLSGIPELVETGLTGWLTPAGDASAIVEALTAIARDWDAASRIARAGQQRIADGYLIEENAGTLARLMEAAQ